jgi:hypothetical protein
MYHLIFILLIISSLAYTAKASAFGKQGHQLICQLSYQHLSIAKQESIKTLLTLLPKADKKLINQYNYKPINEKITFAKACTWPDAVKKSPKYKKFQRWHYMNVDRATRKITKNTCKNNCITQAIHYHQQQLSNQEPWQKLQALMFLGHWLGDIHQPLHISFASDLGGNKTKIHSPTKCTNLHWYWDECLLTASKKSKVTLLAELNNLWQLSEITKWQSFQPAQWANESFNIMKSHQVKYCQDDKGTCEKIAGITAIDKNYQDTFELLIQKRMVQAAARLSMILTNNL